MEQNADQLSLTRILQLLRCPRCCELPSSGPIYACERGHTLCGTCYEHLEKDAGPGEQFRCVVCHAGLSGGRNAVAEQLVRSLGHRVTSRSRQRLLGRDDGPLRVVCDRRPSLIVVRMGSESAPISLPPPPPPPPLPFSAASRTVPRPPLPLPPTPPVSRQSPQHAHACWSVAPGEMPCRPGCTCARCSALVAFYAAWAGQGGQPPPAPSSPPPPDDPRRDGGLGGGEGGVSPADVPVSTRSPQRRKGGSRLTRGRRSSASPPPASLRTESRSSPPHRPCTAPHAGGAPHLDGRPAWPPSPPHASFADSPACACTCACTCGQVAPPAHSTYSYGGRSVCPSAAGLSTFGDAAKDSRDRKVSMRPVRCPKPSCDMVLAATALVPHFAFDHSDVPLLPVDPGDETQLWLSAGDIPLEMAKVQALLLLPIAPGDRCSVRPTMGEPLVSRFGVRRPLPLLTGRCRLAPRAASPGGDEGPGEGRGRGDEHVFPAPLLAPSPTAPAGAASGDAPADGPDDIHEDDTLVMWLADIDAFATYTMEVADGAGGVRRYAYSAPAVALRLPQTPRSVYRRGEAATLAGSFVRRVTHGGGFTLTVVVH